MRKVIIDLDGKASRDEVHGYIAGVMDFPDYYGGNLDAMYDCLMEIPEPTCVAVFNLDEDNECHMGVAEVLRDCADNNGNICVVFQNLEMN